MKQKITDLRQIVKTTKRGVYLIQKDFKNTDLSDLNLSVLSRDQWHDAIFHNTDLSNTKIRFSPRKLKPNRYYRNYQFSVEDCNFESTDLSYLDETDWEGVCIKGCNFRNTNVKIDLYNQDITGVLLDKQYAEKEKEYWNDVIFDIQTLMKNDFIKITQKKLLQLISAETNKKYYEEKEETQDIVKCAEKYLEQFGDEAILKFYNDIFDNSEPYEKLSFFLPFYKDHCAIISISKKIECLDLHGIDCDILSNLYWNWCTIDKLVLCNNISELTQRYSLMVSDTARIKDIVIRNLSFDSWKDIKSTRVTGTHITFRRNVYVELGRECNCNCSFCRNKSFECDCNQYDIDKIITELCFLYRHDMIDNIIIGGGEPTFRLDDFMKIYSYIPNQRMYTFITNGSLKLDTLESLLYGYVNKVYISRHALSDEDNIKILKPNDKNSILTLEEISNCNYMRGTTFTPVCVKGGLDSKEKILAYIDKAFEIGVGSILISSLHKDASLGSKNLKYDDLYVSPKIFDEVKVKLKEVGFVQSKQICSNGGYVLYILKDDTYTVVFKEYITKEELNTKWEESPKKTFDFTLTPSGELYSDWCRETKAWQEDI